MAVNIILLSFENGRAFFGNICSLRRQRCIIFPAGRHSVRRRYAAPSGGSSGVNNRVLQEAVKMNVIRVKADAVPGDLANIIVRYMRREGKMQLRAVGAAAINQTVKAIAISRNNLVSVGADVVCSPWFSEVYINDKLKTAITFYVELRWPEEASATA